MAKNYDGRKVGWFRNIRKASWLLAIAALCTDSLIGLILASSSPDGLTLPLAIILVPIYGTRIMADFSWSFVNCLIVFGTLFCELAFLAALDSILIARRPSTYMGRWFLLLLVTVIQFLVATILLCRYEFCGLLYL